MDDLEGRDRQAPVISTGLIVAVLCVAVTAGACSASSSSRRETPPDSGNPTLAPPEGRGLQPVPRPELSTMGDAVRPRIQQAYTALTHTVEDPRATPEQLAKAYGEVGDLLMSLNELESAEAYYLNAQTLDPAAGGGRICWGISTGTGVQWRRRSHPLNERANSSRTMSRRSSI